jgi:ethanolaminephosphotransferase
LEVAVFDPFWNFIVSKLPMRLAPNLLTLMGIIFPVMTCCISLYLDQTFSKPMDTWFFLLSAFAFFWYSTIDAIDGKQARRTDNCSPLGQILDHTLDMISHTSFFVFSCQMTLTTTNFWIVILYIPSVMAPHYAIEYRKYFTNFHNIIVGSFGPTEGIMSMILMNLYCALHPQGSLGLFNELINVGGVSITLQKIFLYYPFFISVRYNLENFYFGFIGAKDKIKAILYIYPLIHIYVLFFITTYSQFY